MRKFLKILLFTFIFFMFNSMVFANSKLDMIIKYDNKTEKYTADKVNIIIDGNQIQNFKMQPIILEGRVLVPLRDVFENMGAEVSWDNDKREAIVTKDSDKIFFGIDKLQGIKNDTEQFNFEVPPKIINDFTMVPIRAVSDALNYKVEWDNETRTVSITKPKIVEITESTSDIQENSSKQDVSVIENTINQKQNGIKIVWDQISNVKANDSAGKRDTISGLDVISPTWFAISDLNGNIMDKGSIEYANWAKQQGYKIWGLVTNSFDAKLTHQVLSEATKRTKVINDLVSLAKKYGLDGINIDFESIAKEDGVYYLKFIQEATPIFKQNGLVVSVDMYVPTKWTEHYNMAEVAKVVDYVIIMAYDEHYSTSKVSGSVASMTWVDTHMKRASELVPKEKLIMGVPFYTRVWTETKNIDGTVSVVSKSLKMDEAFELLKKNNANIVWDDKTGQYYGEYFSEGTTKKIWLEEEKSIEERMKISRKYDVAGVAGWKRGHENNKIWDIINKYYK